MTKRAPLVLGSSSPRRQDLLRQLGYEFTIVRPEVPEILGEGERPQAYVSRLAAEKSAWVAGLCRDRGQADAVIVSADTVVVIDDRILEKPADDADACRMLGEITGRAHVVYTGVSVRRVADDHSEDFVVATTVHLQAMTPTEIAAYVRTGEPMDKAGSYAAQGLGAFMVERLEGSYTNVVGLPLTETVKVLTTIFSLPPPNLG